MIKRSFSIALAVIIFASPALAQSSNAQWEMVSGKLNLKVAVQNQLSKKQKNLIQSGFSTYSVLEIFRPEGQYTPETSLFRAECTVNYDTWEETYDVYRIDTKKRIEKAKAFKSYADTCLSAVIDDSGVLEYFAKAGGYFWADLRIDQISQDKAEEMRQWLIKQQSGVVKGIFSHMLGDIKVSEQVRIKVEIPVYALNHNPEDEHEIMALYPTQSPISK